MATAALVGSSIVEIPTLLASPPPYQRKDVGGLAASDPILTGYAKAIRAMRALAVDDPLSWAYQAAIHGTTLSCSYTSWNTCEHGTYFFLSWHRMYLWYFERIIRKMAGDPNWTLPFWNWESTSERTLPAPFRTPADPSNDLFASNRGFGWNDGTSSLASSTVDTSAAMPETLFTNFSSSLEGTPHGAVHVSIGGWMGSVPTAAQDPIFWLHHCNIDRLWNAWLAQGGGRVDPLGDATWKNTKFTFFDENGTQVQLTGCDILRAQDQLGYNYEGEPAQVNFYCSKIVKPPIWILKEILKLPPPPDPGPGPDPTPWEINVGEVREQLAKLARTKGTDLRLELSEVVADKQPTAYLEVYIGLPKSAAPEPKSPHYVGNIALFGHGIREEKPHGKFHPASFSFPITRALEATFQRDPRARTLSALFVPRGPLREGKPAPTPLGARLHIGAASLSLREHRTE
ncbi:MAG TPA: tyrosinase family protein [Thermoanaerobaculia bacterium]|nr:tyrosinase family protein [Thermoanaerobaculia bacterium]